ncbi:DNA replication protein SLD5 [Saccharomyces eubayanus]|uniref:DNA replication protein SLD5 n=1 Tax=Saccharomyces eubayanus TaxID=1080349 RepID=UPI0006C720A4|nr:SLD5-like protein [Saccharomyces eubayanus]KOH01294.1 SLD5-like protein [Saccharomyces eubayanus]
MDINIDDILAELDKETTAVDSTNITQGSSSTAHGDALTIVNSSLDSSVKTHTYVSPQRDFANLMKCWRNERCSPELLAYPHQLMKRLLNRISAQSQLIENISMGFLDMQNASSANRSMPNDSKLPLLCMETELERLKFVIRSYVRCRLGKIDKFSLYLRQLNEDENSLTSLTDLLSGDEIKYHDSHSLIWLKLINDSILKYMPEELQAINDTEGSVSMIDEPDWNKFVFIHVNGPPEGHWNEDPLLQENEFGKPCYTVTIPDLNEEVELTIGSIYVMRYEVIRDLLRDDKIALI